MDLPEPFRTTIQPAWIDYNGHLNEAYYVLVMSHATDAIIDWMGMDDVFRTANAMSIYTLETHICYLQEVHVEQQVEVRTRLLDMDAKRMHLFHGMTVAGEDSLRCTGEMLMACIDMTGPKSVAFPDRTRERLIALQQRDRGMAWPERAGRSVAIRRTRPRQ